MTTLFEKREQLREVLRQFSPMLIAYSGGVDSAYLLAEARCTLGAEKMRGVIADSASLPRKALDQAIALAAAWDVPLEVIRTEELDNPQYASNPVNRCYFCKAELFKQLERMAAERKFCALAYGENADDARQVRPGRQAAAEFSVLAPLREVGLTKAEIRALSREMGLPTADAPAQPCLSSRIPHGTPVTVGALAMVEAGEEWVRNLGFSVFRVRHLIRENGHIAAKLQIDPAEMTRMSELQAQLESGLLAVGYHSVEVDPEGYRSS
ncbi:MAG: ATP-dependent sacrificial sulfur transferase LarE [Verrucomicrobiota bacterium]|jgi:uncharacterized protein